MAALKVLRQSVQAESIGLRTVVTFSRVLNRQWSKNTGEVTDLENLLPDTWEDVTPQSTDLRNKSRLSVKHYKQYHGTVVEPPFKDLGRRRKMYITYGSQSGEDPRQLWPSRQELSKMQEDDHFDEVPLMEKIQLMKQQQDEELKAKAERQATIEKNMAQMSKWIAEYNKKIDDAEAAIQKKREKKEELLEEAKEYFGYRIQANDPKFEQMVEEKEERERKEARELKKKKKAQKLAEKIQHDVLSMKPALKEEKSVEKDGSPMEKNP